jgi:hypothetical protein
MGLVERRRCTGTRFYLGFFSSSELICALTDHLRRRAAIGPDSARCARNEYRVVDASVEFRSGTGSWRILTDDEADLATSAC